MATACQSGRLVKLQAPKTATSIRGILFVAKICFLSERQQLFCMLGAFGRLAGKVTLTGDPACLLERTHSRALEAGSCQTLVGCFIVLFEANELEC